ncbi:hypothetical protein [Flavobacterium sp.]|uniref:hypothetical protein n=1 Tax=Flavobacterium sp. TaxID=239 RepID=UPI00286E7CA3|nr:hypothetical protein [Flavobacterium sp.]
MENSDDQNEYDKYAQEKINQALDEKELKIHWLKEIEQNEAMQNYFKSFNKSSVKSYIDYYIGIKSIWMRYGDFYKEKAASEASQWIEQAHEHLSVILQKKLFDAQCLWRAEQIQLEGVEICFDFTIWEHDIWACPFIEPLTSNEVAMYSDYLTKTDIEISSYSVGDDFQNYEEIKKAYHDSSDFMNMPEWYEYHNTRTGNSSLLLLPDIRGAKEDFYSEIYFKSKEHLDKITENEAMVLNNPDRDVRPYLSTHPKEKIEFFVKTFEDRTVQLKYKYYDENCFYNDEEGQNEHYEELFSKMLETKEPIPIQAHHDFREAIAIAYNHYKCRKIAENLPIAYEQYLFNKKMGFITSKNDNFYRGFRTHWTERLIKGRVLNGEAPDLDF